MIDIEERTFEANQELSDLLKSQGFIDCTTDYDQKKGKLKLKLSKNSQMAIYFDYINIRLQHRSRYVSSGNYTLSETELREILYFFKLPSAEFEKEFGDFKFGSVTERIEHYRWSKGYINSQRNRSKLERLIRLYDEISF